MGELSSQGGSKFPLVEAVQMIMCRTGREKTAKLDKKKNDLSVHFKVQASVIFTW